MKYRITILSLTFLLGSLCAMSQEIKIPKSLPSGHPRLLTDAATGKENLKKLVADNAWAAKALEKTRADLEPYVNRHQSDPQWIVSRLQMYWKSKATDVFVKGPVYSHATGEAPVPTVRFTGARDNQTIYSAPKLEDMMPYADDTKGIYLINTSKPGRPMEWAEQSKSGRTIESINRQIMSKAYAAAFMYWYTGEEKYAVFAADLFDTYMTGMYYRKEPVDLDHSHIQTLVGLTSFEVIHEDVLVELTGTYDFLYGYLNAKKRDKMPLYADTFKKWAGLIIKNGVPFNNWNLIEARFVAYIAFVLENDDAYADGRGSHYYLDQIFNNSVLRQWSIPRLLTYGYDANTGIWNESPGYSLGVMNDFIGFVTLFDQVLHIDLLEQLPVLKKAVLAAPEYLFPNGFTVAFGDTYHGRLSMEAAYKLVANAQRNNKPAQEAIFTRYIRTMEKLGGTSRAASGGGGDFTSLFASAAVVLQDAIRAGKPEEYLSPVFYAPNVSYFVQRNGLDPKHGMMISQAGSKGNHAHANGIAMELFGKGTVLAPEAGIGTNYFQADYKEYYSQFPAHNTVVTDGVSSYPEMRSNHGFEVKSNYPASQKKTGNFTAVTYSDLYFLEPETNANQRRLMSIIRIDSTSGYYVDIFRAAKKEGGDKRNDYFYHNIGQELLITDPTGTPLPMTATDKLAFADGDQFGYDYIWDKRSAVTSNDFAAKFTLAYPGRGVLRMNMWMKGYPGREVFQAKTPVAKAISRGLVPDTIAHLPVPAVIVRQTGAAWNKPFAAVFEPVEGNGSAITSITPFRAATTDSSFVGLKVAGKTGTTDYIFSSPTASLVTFGNMRALANYAVIRTNGNGPGFLFVGNGTLLKYNDVTITSIKPAAIAVSIGTEAISYTSSEAIQLIFPVTRNASSVSVTVNGRLVKAQKITGDQYRVNLPAADLTSCKITIN